MLLSPLTRFASALFLKRVFERFGIVLPNRRNKNNIKNNENKIKSLKAVAKGPQEIDDGLAVFGVRRSRVVRRVERCFDSDSRTGSARPGGPVVADARLKRSRKFRDAGIPFAKPNSGYRVNQPYF